MISPHPFLSQLGTRTDAMIDFDALLQTDVMVAEFFSLVDNHWDVFVETRALWSGDDA